MKQCKCVVLFYKLFFCWFNTIKYTTWFIHIAFVYQFKKKKVMGKLISSKTYLVNSDLFLSYRNEKYLYST